MSCRFEGLQVASAWIVKFPVRVNRRASHRRAMAAAQPDGADHRHGVHRL